MRVSSETREEEKQNKIFNVDRKQREFQGTYLIQPGSIYEQVIADFLEDGLGLKSAMYFVNKMREEANLMPVGLSTIRNTAMRMNTKKG